jgi:hypothetical protein
VRGKGDFMEDLYLPDLIWANAISASILVDNEEVKNLSPNLTGLIRRGLGDREPGEDLRPEEQRAMRYSAACSAHLMDKVHLLFSEVRAFRFWFMRP